MAVHHPPIEAIENSVDPLLHGSWKILGQTRIGVGPISGEIWSLDPLRPMGTDVSTDSHAEGEVGVSAGWKPSQGALAWGCGADEGLSAAKVRE